MGYHFSIESYELPRQQDLESRSVTWELDWSRVVLLVHDMQRYFLRPIPDSPRIPVINNTSALIDYARSAGAPVAYTAQPGGMSAQERGLLRDFWGEGMSSGEDDRDVVDEVRPSASDIFLTKWRYSAFARTPLLSELRQRQCDQLLVCGVYAHVGILATALDCLAEDIKCFVVADATADFSRHHHLNALRYIANRCGQVVFSEAVL